MEGYSERGTQKTFSTCIDSAVRMQPLCVRKIGRSDGCRSFMELVRQLLAVGLVNPVLPGVRYGGSGAVVGRCGHGLMEGMCCRRCVPFRVSRPRAGIGKLGASRRKRDGNVATPHADPPAERGWIKSASVDSESLVTTNRTPKGPQRAGGVTDGGAVHPTPDGFHASPAAELSLKIRVQARLARNRIR